MHFYQSRVQHILAQLIDQRISSPGPKSAINKRIFNSQGHTGESGSGDSWQALRVGTKSAVGAGVTVGFGAVKIQAANSMETSPVSRTRRFMISSFGNMRRLIPAALFVFLLL